MYFKRLGRRQVAQNGVLHRTPGTQRQQIGEEGAQVRVATAEGEAEQGRVPAPQPTYPGYTTPARYTRRT